MTAEASDMAGRSAAGPCGSGGECQRHLAARVAARDSPAGDGGRADGAELAIVCRGEAPHVRFVCDRCRSGRSRVRFVCDLCAICVRSVCDLCAICVRFVCDLCAIHCSPMRGPAAGLSERALFSYINHFFLFLLVRALTQSAQWQSSSRELHSSWFFSIKSLWSDVFRSWHNSM